ncbi:hypothetical protein CZ771_03040 [Actinomycetales bacterium JB111]|nr:hypothetical protein CZ771_03040 [Actinomycetales bacterium JB111]
MHWSITGEIVVWRGPAPFYFLAIDEETSDDVKEAARGLEYWGQVAVVARIGATEFTTALFPRDGRYLLPVKAAVRDAENIEAGDVCAAELTLRRDR